MDAKSPSISALERYRVPILDRTLDLLELLARHPDGLTLTAMTEQLAMPKNSVFRIATSLTLRGYALRDERTKAYRLSRKILALGHSALGGERLLAAASPILTSLRDTTGETALLGTLSGSQGIVLDQVASSHPVKVVVEIGHSFPLHTAAPAKAILAFLPAARSAELIAAMSFPRLTPRTITSAQAYLLELDEVRQTGVALDRGEESASFACAAVPIFNRRGEVMAALWVSGPADRVTEANLPWFAQTVKAHAEMVTARL